VKKFKTLLISVFLLCTLPINILRAEDATTRVSTYINTHIDEACQACLERINEIDMVLPYVDEAEKEKLLKEKEKFEKTIFLIKTSGGHLEQLNQNVQERLDLSEEQIEKIKMASYITAAAAGALIVSALIFFPVIIWFYIKNSRLKDEISAAVTEIIDKKNGTESLQEFSDTGSLSTPSNGQGSSQLLLTE